MTRVEMISRRFGILSEQLFEAKQGEEPVGNDLVQGGVGDMTSNDQVPPDELLVGSEVEKEHTGDDALAQELARDHLTQNPNYYSTLGQIGLVNEPRALRLMQQAHWVQPEQGQQGDN
jgi:hypothetical protein